MAVLSLKYLPDPILRKKARPVAKVDQVIGTLINDMLDTMRDAGGVLSLIHISEPTRPRLLS